MEEESGASALLMRLYIGKTKHREACSAASEDGGGGWESEESGGGSGERRAILSTYLLYLHRAGER